MRLLDYIEANTREIAKEWETFARSLSPSTAGLGDLLLRDHIDEILRAIARDMREPQSKEAQAEKGKGRRENGEALDRAARGHADQRLDVGFRIDQAASELRALRSSIVRLWEGSSPEPAERSLGDLIRFNEAVDEIMIESTKAHIEKLDRYREQFLAILGHDLRTPLGAILLSAEHMSAKGGPDEQHNRIAARILNSAKHMSRLLDDLLDLTSAQLGTGLAIIRRPMDLEGACRQVLDRMEILHPDRVVQFEPSGDLHGEWDIDRVSQIVSNLVGNALQHGNAADPIVVSAEAQGDQIALAVHNEGPAIPRSDWSKIFESQVRSGSTTSARPRSSLGLGLFIVRQIVSAHGGEVAVASSDEQGTTFTVKLPRHAP